MLHFILGAAKSGKSAHAEHLVADMPGATVYIGTLPSGSLCGERILRHRLRRPASWHLIELRGNPETDITLLEGALDKYRNILLDGFTFYVFQLISTFDFEFTILKDKVTSLIRKFANHSGEVVVVDQPVVGIYPARLRLALRYLHLLLAQSAHTLTLIESGRAIPLGRRELSTPNRRG